MKSIIKKILLIPFNIMHKVDEEATLKILFFLKTRRKLNLDNPKSYNEKIQWIKLYDQNPLMPFCSDKYHVRKYINKKSLDQILNDLLWEGFEAENIPFAKLPNSFVIKVSHGQGYNIIARDKNKINKKKVVKKINKWLSEKFMPAYGEWFYDVLKPRIIIERYLEDDMQSVPIDYKIMCFNGEPKYIFIYENRFQNISRTIFDVKWNLVESSEKENLKWEHKPKFIEEMLYYSQVLSAEFNHCRVDFYYINKKVYFGEITFTTAAGFMNIGKELNYEMGSLLKLPKEKIKQRNNEDD